jgi:bifunctional DNase/RNase
MMHGNGVCGSTMRWTLTPLRNVDDVDAREGGTADGRLILTAFGEPPRNSPRRHLGATVTPAVRHRPVGRLVVGAALAVALAPGCKHRSRESLPAPTASSAQAAETASIAPPTAPMPTDSAIVPSQAAFADGGAPLGYERATLWDLVPSGDGAAVLLIDTPRLTVLPIFVGGTEALTIRLRADGERYERPLTHDLLSSLVKELGGSPVKVQIDDLRDDTYFGSVFVRQGERVLQLDARPSDAIAISLGSGIPLFVARSVMLATGVPREQIEQEEREQQITKRKKGSRISL